MDGAQPSAKPIASPPATAEVSLNGKQVVIHYNSPRLKGRTIGTTIVPYGQVWRTGANAATTFITPTNLKIGTLNVPMPGAAAHAGICSAVLPLNQIAPKLVRLFSGDRS